MLTEEVSEYLEILVAGPTFPGHIFVYLLLLHS